MALYALGDLHLSFQADKPMDAFGKVWRHHERKIEKYVNRIVKPEDTLVLTGDHSWGRRLEECREDLAFIERLPGRKILLRGNHDMFWDAKKTRRLNEEYEGRLFFLQNNFAVYEDYALVGTKGYTFEGPFYLDRWGNVFNHRSNIDMDSHRVLCFQLKSLGKALKEIGLLIMQDAVWNRVTANREKHKTTWFYIDEFHLLLKGQTGAFSVEIWKRFRKWGGIPSGLTQNVKDLLASREIENIFENSDFIYMLNQAQGDRQILAKQLGISPTQLSYVTHSGPGEGLLFFGNVIIPFVDHFPKDTSLYQIMTTRPEEVAEAGT